MGRFLESEKIQQYKYKLVSPYYSDKAKANGIYKNKSYPFCLPREYADENLFIGIRQPVLDYFALNNIKWHDGMGEKPSNHLCDSQVCCVNFLFPFHNKPEALAGLFRPLYSELEKMLPMEAESYVACEWIGLHNYLQEGKSPHNDKRTRGANYTSADAAVKFVDRHNKVHIVLIEWKYTESYYPTPLKYAYSRRNPGNPTDRTAIYIKFYEDKLCPIDKSALTDFECLFYEPFYQLMRQQFLAHEMEKAHELDADIVSLLHIAPNHNAEFKRITSPGLIGKGDTATQVWQKFILDKSRFTTVYTEDFFGKFDIKSFPELNQWWDYITARYARLTEPPVPVLTR